MTQSLAAATVPDGTRSESADGSSNPLELISFAIGDHQYGVDIMAVREIKGWTEIRPLPRQHDYVRGVLNLRGGIVPIVDLRRRFEQGLTEATPLHVVIIVQISDQSVGLLADRVLDIVSFDAASVQPVPRTGSHSQVEFVSRLVTIEGAMIALIDLTCLFSSHLDHAGAPPAAA